VKFIGLVIQRMIEDKFQNHSKHKRQFNMLEMFGLEIIILFVAEVGSNKRELIRGAGSRGIQIDKNVLVSF
jgi:hypothetical protein